MDWVKNICLSKENGGLGVDGRGSLIFLC